MGVTKVGAVAGTGAHPHEVADDLVPYKLQTRKVGQSNLQELGLTEHAQTLKRRRRQYRRSYRKPAAAQDITPAVLVESSLSLDTCSRASISSHSAGAEKCLQMHQQSVTVSERVGLCGSEDVWV